MKPCKILLTTLLFVITSPLYSQLRSLETKYLRLVYFGEAQSYLIPHVAGCFENALKSHAELFGYTPSEKITLLLYDYTDYGNAGAAVIPNNRVFVAIAPFNYTYEFTPSNERINWVMNHELVHILAGDKASKTDHFFRTIFFGKVFPTAENPLSLFYGFLTNPRNYAPLWYHEGIAVFMETWRSGGLGRVLGAYDEMVFRTMVHDQDPIYDYMNLESTGTKTNFQPGLLAYLYGARFFSYLAYRYGPESLIKWVSRNDESRAYFASQFRKVYGVSMHKAWSQWIEREKEFQRKNLERIRMHPVTPFRDVSRRPLGSVSRAFYDSSSGEIYLAVKPPGREAYIASLDIDSGKIKKICPVKDPALHSITSLTYDPFNSTLFYTTANNGRRNLKSVNVKTGRTKKLMDKERIGDLAFNSVDRSLWGVRHDNGISTIVRIPPPYKEWEQIFSWPYGKDIYDLDISPDGKFLVGALTQVNGNQELVRMKTEALQRGDFSYDTLSDFKNSSPANFVFSPDKKYLYGSSYYSGVSNIYRYDLEEKKTRIITNCETGFFKPVCLSENSLLVFRYTSRGFFPVVIPIRPVEHVNAIHFFGQGIVEKHPIVKDWKAAPPSSAELDSLTVYKGKYKAFKNIKLRSIYPIVEGYKDSAAYGFRSHLTDPIHLHDLDFTVSYSPGRDVVKGERLHLKFNYSYLNWKFTAAHNGADFYDLFGPTKKSRKGDSVEVEYKKGLDVDKPNRFMDYSIRLAGYTGLDRLPDYQHIVVDFDTLFSLRLKLNYVRLRRFPGAADGENGIRWRFVFSNYYANKKIYPRLFANVDFGFFLPIVHSSIRFRSFLGYSWGNREEPLSNFYFGGFGNNAIDRLPVKRYRRHDSFPGVGLNEIGGKNYGKFLLEWNLPSIRFKRLGLPFFYADGAGVSFFSTGIMTNLDKKEVRRRLFNLGLQVDFRLMVLSHHKVTFSAGYAIAFEKGRDRTEEWMFSLRVNSP